MIHLQEAPKTRTEVNRGYLDLLHSLASWPIYEEQRFPQSFSHIFVGGYAAGYYSYLWADVLSCDAYDWFAEDLDAITQKGAHFRETILSKGGSVPALEAFIAFRGREPDEKALLRSYGL
jgi:oligopeptidase A